MDDIRRSMNGLSIQDPRHELAKNPPLPPSSWDRNKYPSVLVPTSPPSSRTYSRPINFPSESERSRFETDSVSPVSSRPSSIANSSCYSRNSSIESRLSSAERSSVSSCYSRNSSTGSILSNPERSSISSTHTSSSIRAHNPIHSGFDRFPVLVNSLGAFNERPKHFPPVTLDREPLYELAPPEEKNRVVVKNFKGSEAFHLRKMMNDKDLRVEHDLEKEQRHIRRNRAAKVAKLREPKSTAAQCLSDLPCVQTLPDVKHMLGSEVCGEGSLSTGTHCDLSPSQCSETSDIPGYRAEHRSITTSSNIGSQADSTSSEDATDWENDSDMEDSSTALQDRLQSFLGTRSEFGLSRVLTELSPMKSKLVDNLMLDFWTIFDSSWPYNVQQHGSSCQSTVSRTTAESRTTSRDSSSARYGKRDRNDDGENEEGDDYNGRRRKRAPVDKMPAVREDDLLGGRFACPFRKHNPRKYSIQNWPRCAEKPQKTIARLKAHLYQYHLIEQCPRCKLVLGSEEALEAHNMSNERCEAKTEERADGMTRKMKDQIQCRRRLHPGQTDTEKWRHVYQILFPNEAIPEPYFEPVPDHDIQRSQSPDSVNIAHYEEYLRQVLPGYVRNALESAVDHELQPIEIELHRRMIDMIKEAQNQAFISFRDKLQSDSGIISPTGSPSDVTIRAGLQHHTSIEAFFQAPPPAENQVSYPELSDLRNPQRDGADIEASDSGYGSRPSVSTSSRQDSSENTALSSSSNDQIQMTSNIPMDTRTFDPTDLLSFDAANDTMHTGRNWLHMPQSLQHFPHKATPEPNLSGLGNYHNSPPSKEMVNNNSTAFEEPGNLNADFTGYEYFDWDNEGANLFG